MEEMDDRAKPIDDMEDDFDSMSSTSSDFSFVSKPDSHSDYEEISVADAMNNSTSTIDGEVVEPPSVNDGDVSEPPSVNDRDVSEPLSVNDRDVSEPPLVNDRDVSEPLSVNDRDVSEPLSVNDRDVSEPPSVNDRDVSEPPSVNDRDVMSEHNYCGTSDTGYRPPRKVNVFVTPKLLRDEDFMLKDEVAHKSVVVREQPRREELDCSSNSEFVPLMVQVGDSSLNSSISQASSLKSRRESLYESHTSLDVENDIMKELVNKQKTELDRYDEIYCRDQDEIKKLRSETRYLSERLEIQESSIEVLSREKSRLETDHFALNRTLEKCALKEEEMMEKTKKLNCMLETAENERLKLEEALHSCQTRVHTLQQELAEYRVRAQEDSLKLIENENIIQSLNLEKAEMDIKLADETQRRYQLQSELQDMETEVANTDRYKEESKYKICLLERQIKDLQLRQDDKINQEWEILSSDFEPSQHSSMDPNLMFRPDPKNSFDDFDVKTPSELARPNPLQHEEDCDGSVNSDSEGEENHFTFEGEQKAKKVDDIIKNDQTKIDEEMDAEKQNILQAYGVIVKKRSEHQKRTNSINSLYLGENEEAVNEAQEVISREAHAHIIRGVHREYTERLMYRHGEIFLVDADRRIISDNLHSRIITHHHYPEDSDEEETMSNEETFDEQYDEAIYKLAVQASHVTEQNEEAISKIVAEESLATEQNEEAISKIVVEESLATEQNDEAISKIVTGESLATEQNDEAISKIVAEESLATEQNEEAISKIVAEESLATEQNEDVILQTAYDESLSAERNEVLVKSVMEESKTSELPSLRTHEYYADTIRVNLDEELEDEDGAYSMEGRENRTYFSSFPSTGFTAPVFMPQPAAPTVDVLPSPLQPNLTNIAKRAAVAGANQIRKTFTNAIQIIQDTPWDALVSENTFSDVNSSDESQEDNPTRPVSPYRNVEPHRADDDGLYGATAIRPKTKCPLCPMEFPGTPEGEAAANAHANEHLDVPPTQYCCPFCSLKFELNCLGLYTEHVESHLENTCPVCGDIFARGEKTRYETHVNRHFEDEETEERSLGRNASNSPTYNGRFPEID